jgi:diaminobutyrate-2-oxoglutarate transaminase
MGVIVERCGPNGEVIKLMPPINTPTDELASGLETVARGITGDGKSVI